MGNGSSRRILLVSFLILLIVTMGFTGGLNIFSFRQNYTTSIVRNYALIGQEAVRKIEYALKYGKDIGNFYGIKDILGEIAYHTEGNSKAGIIMPDGKMLYAFAESDKKEIDWCTLLEKGKSSSSEGDISYFSILENDSHYVFLPIREGQTETIAYLAIVFDDELVWSKTEIYINRLLLYLISLTLLAGIIFAALLWRGRVFSFDESKNKKSLLKTVLILVGIIQIGYGFLNYQIFKEGYLSLAEENVATMSGILQQNIGDVVEKGVPYDKLYGLDNYLQTIDDSMPEINGIRLGYEDGRTLYATPGYEAKDVKDQGMVYSVELLEDVYKHKSIVSVGLSSDYLAEKVKNILLDMLSMLAVSIFFLVEITLFGLVFLEGKIKNSIRINKVFDVGRIRPLTFIVYTASSLSAAFIPLAMKKLYQPILNLPEGVVIGLPISAEMLCALITTIYAGSRIDRAGWKPFFSVGVIVLAVGNIVSSLVTNGLLFIAARGITGAGFGLMLMGMRTYIIGSPLIEERTKGIAGMNAGALAGLSCGAVTGAMFADRIGFEPVFLLSGILVLLGLFFALSYMPNVIASREGEERINDTEKIRSISLRHFLTDRQVMTFLILVLVPFSIISMYLVYYLPLFTESIGISVGDTGRIFLLNGICIIYAGPFLSRYVVKNLGNRRATIFSLAIFVAALLVFAYLNSLAGMLVSVVLLGIAESFGVASNTNYYLGLEKTIIYGEGKAVGLYSVVNKFGQMLAPLIFGIVGSVVLARGAGVVGVGIAVLLVIFILFSSEKNRQVSCINEQGTGNKTGTKSYRK